MTFEMIEHGTTNVALGRAERRYWRQRKRFLQAAFADYIDQFLTQETNTSMEIYRPEEAGSERD
jgi:hypothetical protein